MALLNVNNLQKVYTTRLGGAKVQALAGVSFTVEEGEFVAIMGESGSGKTTLLNILAGLDKPTGGEVFLNMRNIVTLNEREKMCIRDSNSSPQRDGALSSQAESSTVPFPSFKVTRPLSSARRRATSRGAAIFITATLTQAPAAGEPSSPRTVISNSFTGA